VDLFVRSGPRVDPYFRLLMSDSMVRWQNVWFFMRNDADTLLPLFMGSHPIPQPKWGYGVAKKDRRRLQPLHPAVAMRWVDGRECPADVSHPPRPTTLLARGDYVDVSTAKLSQSSFLHSVGRYGDQHLDPGVLAHGANRNFVSGPVPLREGVNSPWVSLLELTSVCLCQFLHLNTHVFLCRILGMCAAPHRGSPYPRMR
jgi:hypothetical protein